MAKRKTTKKSVKKKAVPPKKSPDVPATQAMIYELREEMKNSISSLESKVDAGFKSVDSSIKKVVAELHRVALVVEEQNARNKYVLDGYTSLNDRVERLEKKVFDENM